MFCKQSRERCIGLLLPNYWSAAAGELFSEQGKQVKIPPLVVFTIVLNAESLVPPIPKPSDVE